MRNKSNPHSNSQYFQNGQFSEKNKNKKHKWKRSFIPKSSLQTACIYYVVWSLTRGRQLPLQKSKSTSSILTCIDCLLLTTLLATRLVALSGAYSFAEILKVIGCSSKGAGRAPSSQSSFKMICEASSLQHRRSLIHTETAKVDIREFRLWKRIVSLQSPTCQYFRVLREGRQVYSLGVGCSAHEGF